MAPSRKAIYTFCTNAIQGQITVWRQQYSYSERYIAFLLGTVYHNYIVVNSIVCGRCSPSNNDPLYFSGEGNHHRYHSNNIFYGNLSTTNISIIIIIDTRVVFFHCRDREPSYSLKLIIYFTKVKFKKKAISPILIPLAKVIHYCVSTGLFHRLEGNTNYPFCEGKGDCYLCHVNNTPIFHRNLNFKRQCNNSH